MAAPWGAGKPYANGSLTFEAIPGPDSSTSGGDATVSDPSGTAPTQTISLGGARTHYAVDVKRDGSAVLRLVILDSSFGSLTASDPVQQPREQSGQLQWLDRVTCLQGSASGCTRLPAEQAVVVTETPTYSYGPGATTSTATDATAMEQTLIKNQVNGVVSGRLGWNALYWTTAAGVHSPCAGDSYPDPTKVPAAGSKPCTQSTSQVPGTSDAAGQAQSLAGSLQGINTPSTPGCSGQGANPTGVIPNVIASSAGGKFGPDGQASGTVGQGYWHGYTIVRLDRSGDPACTIIEQRPVLDFVAISAPEHTLRPGQHMVLHGYGREPVGASSTTAAGIVPEVTQYDAIDTPAVTHRYDLVRADPQRPWMPLVESSSPFPNHYVPLDQGDCQIGCLDPSNGQQTGKVLSGRGNHPRVYALAILSVGSQAASWPLVFESRRSYAPSPPARILTSTPPVLPQVHVGAIAATSPPPPPSAPPPAPPVVGTPTLPQLPGLPGLPPLNTPPPAAPPPPAGAAPPAPPASQAPSALSISVSPQSVGFAPPSGVGPPPAPPINPAPPGGARREAKAKQPAAAKSEETGGGDEKAQVDLAEGPPGASGAHMTRHHDNAMTRRDRDRPPISFTPLTHGSQRSWSGQSAWSRDVIYGGGLVAIALLLALTSTALPTSRRSQPPAGAPAWARKGPRTRR
jgi:hypothetical protein